MALTQVTGPYPIFTDLDGSPLDDGYLYIGASNQDPETNPIQVYWDSGLTIPATQPIRTNNGYAWRNGTPGLLYTAGDFSITIRNKRNEFVLYSPLGYGFDPKAISASVVKNDFVGDGVQINFTLSASPSTVLATNIFINGVYQEKDSYGLSANVITFSVAPPLGSSIEIITNETGVINSGNANDISYTLTAPGAALQSVQTKLEQYVSVKDFGAVGDGVADDTAAFIQACSVSDTVFVPQGQYKLLSTIPIADSMVLEDGAVLVADTAGVYDNIVLSSGSPETAKVFLHLTSPRGRFSGGQVKGYSGGTLAAIFSANYQQTISETYITDFPFGIYSDNHSSFYLNNIIENCTIGFKGMETNFNGDTIAFNHFEVCATCIYLDNGPSGGQIDSCFINNNLFNFYSTYGVRLNSSVADFHHVIIDNNYFEAGGAGTSGVKMEGTGYYTNVAVTNNMTLGTSANSYFVRVDNNTPCELTVSGNSAFNHLYVVYTKQALVAEENHGFGNTYWYEYGKAASSGSVVSVYGDPIIDTRPTTRTRTKVYDIGDQMTGVYALTNVVNNGAYANLHWDAGAGPAPAVSYYTGYIYRDFQFDMQMRLGDGWRAELVCRMNPALTSDYYLFGVRNAGGVYSFVLQSVGTTPATQTQNFADPGIPRNNWGIRGRVVGQYFSIEAYNNATGVAFASHVFTDATYSIGYAGMYCNSLASAGEAYVIQNYIGPY